jgi:hypothetical protein
MEYEGYLISLYEAITDDKTELDTKYKAMRLMRLIRQTEKNENYYNFE